MNLALRHYMAGLFILSILLYIPLSEGLALISQNAQFDQDLAALKSSITSARTIIFGKENLILQPITAQQERAWRHMMEGADGQLGVKGFVDFYAPRFSSDYVTLYHASMQIITNLKFIFNQYVLAALRHPDYFQGVEWPDPKKINLETIDLNGIETRLQKIEAAKEMIEAMSQDVKGRWLVFGRHKPVANVLLQLGHSLIMGIEKAQLDYKALKLSAQEYREEQRGARRPRMHG